MPDSFRRSDVSIGGPATASARGGLHSFPATEKLSDGRALRGSEALRYRMVVAQKRQQLCMHFLDADGCALGSLCPFRHPGTRGPGASSPSSSATTEGNTVGPTPATTYRSSIRPHPRSRVFWIWAGLPAVSGASEPLRWHMFGEEWTECLETEFLEAHSRCRATESKPQRQVLQRGFAMDWHHMVLQVETDGGSRRAVQRIDVTESPSWFLVTTGSSGFGDPAGSSSTPSAAVSVDAVAAQFLEYQYASGCRSAFTVEINRRVMRVNLMTMVASVVQDQMGALRRLDAAANEGEGSVGASASASEAAAARARAAANLAVVARRFGQWVSAPEAGLPVAPQRQVRYQLEQSKAGDAIDGCNRFRLVRQEITVRCTCPASDPYDHPVLRERAVVAVSEGPSEAPRVQLVTDDHGHVFGVPFQRRDASLRPPLLLPPLRDLFTGGLQPPLRASVELPRCEIGVAACAWQSGTHIWSASHVCRFVRRRQCPLCEEESTDGSTGDALPKSVGPGAAGTAGVSWENESRRRAVHQRLFLHDVPLSQQEASLIAQKGDETGPAAVWRRQLGISRWFRSEWDVHGETVADGTGTTIVMHAVSHRSTEASQLRQLLGSGRRGGGGGAFLQERRPSRGGFNLAKEEAASLVPNTEASAELWSVLRAALERRAPSAHRGELTNTVDAEGFRGFSIQRVQHSAAYARYLRIRTETFVEWQQVDSAAATASQEEVLFLVMPQSALARLADALENRTVDIPNTEKSSDGSSNSTDDDAVQPRPCVERWSFYHTVDAAAAAAAAGTTTEEPHVLLVVVAYLGSTIRLSQHEAKRITTPPLRFSWSVNDVERLDDDVRRFRQYHAVVCDTGAARSAEEVERHPLSLSAPTADKDTNGPPLLNRSAEGSRSTRTGSGSGERLTSAPLSPGPPQSTSTAPLLDAGAKMVFLYDITQWCPMYILGVGCPQE